MRSTWLIAWDRRLTWQNGCWKTAFRLSSRLVDMRFIWMPGACSHISRKQNSPGRHWWWSYTWKAASARVEIGSVMFAHPDPETGKIVHPDLELVRLAIPRRVYTQTHLDSVVETLVNIARRKDQIHGYRFTYAPELLRHFTARFAPL